MSYALDFHSGKTVESSILRVETLDSPRTVSTGESPQKKRGNFILATRECSSEEYSHSKFGSWDKMGGTPRNLIYVIGF
jgi:hypothetical protein